MKRILHSAHILAAAAALCLLGCTQESVPETERTWTVSAELSSVSTKVTVDTGYKLHWSKGDNVRLIALNSETSAEAQLTVYDVDAGLEKAMFKGEVTMASMPTACIFAYPYNGTSVSGTSTTYSYTSQDYTLSPYLWGKAAYSTPEIDCSLSHIGGTIHLANIASNIVSVTLKGNNSEAIGQVVVDADGTTNVSGATEITVQTSGTGYAYDAYINVPPVNFTKGFTIIAQTLSGETQYRSFSTSGAADSGFDFTSSDGSGKLVEIQWDGFTSFGITASATIAHTTDGSGNLNGSAVTLNSFTVTGAPSKIITEYGVDLYKGTPESGTLVRTLTQSTSPAANTTLTDAGTGWPYLPSSNTTYTLRPWCRIHGGEPLYGTQKTLSSPAPTFEVKVSAYTSYDKYLESDISTANACTAETIYSINSSITISDALRNNSNYGYSSNITLDGASIGTLNSTYVSIGDKTNQSWASHPLIATATFDGVTQSKQKDCIITGLPYTANPPTNSGAHPWSGDGAYSFSSTYVKFGGGGGDGSCSLSFFIPANINILLSAKIYSDSRAVITTTYVDVSGKRVMSCKASRYNSKTLEDTVNDVIFYSNNNTVSTGTTYGLGLTQGRTYYIILNYR